MPFRIKIEEGGDRREYVVYNKEEIDNLVLALVDRRLQRLLDGDISRVDSNLQAAQDEIDDLNNNKLPALETELDTLDGYIQDPSTIPDSYTFFEGIVASQAWIDELVANQAWLDNLFVNNAYADRITANEINVDKLSAISASMGALDVDDILTIGAGGSLQGSNWLINEDTWAHPALGGVVWSLANKAGFSTGSTVSSLSTGSWTTQASAIDGNTTNIEEIKQKIQYHAKEGINELTLTGFVNRTSSGDGSGSGAIKIGINGQSAESGQVATSSFSEVSATVSNLNLTPGNTYVVDVILKASSSANTGQGVSHTTEANLRDDIILSEGVS